jgi:hypothetical protein
VRFVFDIAVAFLVAVVTGVSSAWLAVEHAPLFDPLRVGPWTAWPRAGGPDADPYDLAAAARNPSLPLGNGEGLAFTATTDDSGAPLDGTCRYEIGGQTPPAQLWTLTAYATDGALMANPAGRSTFHSREITRNGDGSFAIELAAGVQPGNWLPVSANTTFDLVLRLYDTPLTSTARPTTITMPSIHKSGCP